MLMRPRSREGTIVKTRMPLVEEDREPASATHSLLQAQIAERAYEQWKSRGCHHGHDVEDWLRAEQEVLERRHGASAGTTEAAEY